ncbi:septum site-determining protein MinC [Guyparkeria hydrothermalis]|uniref:septum site-determining protein MinC n=1 Tax=Guyparkeria hydrothermalis TaxID=923 RepID=UPI002021420A|nr:septum site-determining protein MinC [Guyparkeria hydrothermalis]MCL7743631.1 septum site-determining protein MinC [Guyparkeria hydrothermalis]
MTTTTRKADRTGTPALDIDQRPLTLTHVHLFETHLLKLTRSLSDRFGNPGVGDEREPCVIDLAVIADSGKWIDFPALVSLLRNYRLEPVGVVHGNEQQKTQARGAELPVFDDQQAAPPAPPAAAEPAPKPEPQPEPEPVAAPEPKPEAPARPAGPVAPMILRHPVRSGTELYAQGQDMVVMNTVGAGARVVADGSIYIHGALKGTAAAGAGNQTEARIFCESFEPEIIAICGTFLDGEQLARHPAWGKRVVVELKDGQLVVQTFD